MGQWSFLVQLYVLSADEELNEIEVKKHPEVVKAVEEAVATTDASSISITQEMYVEALKNGIMMAEEKKREKNPSGPK